MKKGTKKNHSIRSFAILLTNSYLSKRWLTLIAIFLVHLSLRFYQIEDKSIFGWDQVDNAWAAKNIIVDHKILLDGMVAKQNTGFYIGPIYYYYVALFYWIFNLNPIVFGYIAGITSIISFFVFFYVTKKIFSFNVALMMVFIHTVTLRIINFDRNQWPINFVAPISLIIFYYLFRTLSGDVKKAVYLGIFIGLSFHLNFTSIFFPIILLFCIPFFPRTKESIKYYSLGTLFIFLALLPSFISETQKNGASTRNLEYYLSTYYHGLHLRRFLQLTHDAFIEIGTIIKFVSLEFLSFLVLPFFCYLYLKDKMGKENFIICYLVILWFFVPWLVFSVYSGEITDYYFAMTRPIALIIVAYILVRAASVKNTIPKIALAIFLVYYSYINLKSFFGPQYRPYSYHNERVLKFVETGEKVEFKQGNPESYLYYYYKEYLSK